MVGFIWFLFAKMFRRVYRIEDRPGNYVCYGSRVYHLKSGHKIVHDYGDVTGPGMWWVNRAGE